MEQKIKLIHPQGKKAVSIDKSKYELLKNLVTKFLRDHDDATFTAISKGVENEIKADKIKFEGSLTWYLEWVKLDLEAKHIITRVSTATPQKYSLAIK